MKQVSIQDLKSGLSSWVPCGLSACIAAPAVAEAESGRTILITRHNEPVARGTKGRYLAVLQDDRGSR